MRIKGTIPLLLPLVVACAPTVFVHPTKTAADINKDKYDCQRDAEQSAYQMGLKGNPFWISDTMKQCLMDKHGWVPQTQEDYQESKTVALADQNKEFVIQRWRN